MPIFAASLQESINHQKEEYQKEHKQNISFLLHIYSPWSKEFPLVLEQTKTIWEGSVGISEEYFREGSSRQLAIHSGSLHDFAVPMTGRAWVEMHA